MDASLARFGRHIVNDGRAPFPWDRRPSRRLKIAERSEPRERFRRRLHSRVRTDLLKDGGNVGAQTFWSLC